MTDTKYNGWTNYETWAVNLWLSNDQGSCEYWQERLNSHLVDIETDDPEDYAPRTLREELAFRLADEIESHHEEYLPEFPTSVYSDLLSAALSSVNWHEIASAMTDE